MPQWIQVMLSTPDRPLSPLARYTQLNGFLYLALGFFIYAWPGAMGPLGAGPLEGQEPALFRLIGFAIATITRSAVIAIAVSRLSWTESWCRSSLFR